MVKTGFDPRAIVNLMIACANKRDIPLPNVSIQKLLYFAHGASLTRRDQPLIRGAFEAWEYGPVCRPIYDELKRHGRNPVTELITRVDPFTGEVSHIEPPSDQPVIDLVEDVVRSIGHLRPGHLIALSHVENGAWHEVWNKAKTGATIGNRIDDILIKERFPLLKISLTTQPFREDPDEATPYSGD